MTYIRTTLLSCLLPLALGGCGALNWFDSEDPPLPGERIAVRKASASSVTVDATAEAIALPAPVANSDWPQSNGGPQRDIGHVAAGTSLSRVWTANVGEGNGSSGRIVSPPIVAKGRVYALDAGATVTAHDASSGARVWSANLTPENENTIDGFGGGLAYANDRVYVSNGFGNLSALNAASGEVLWATPLGAPSRAAPAISGNRVYAVTRDNRIIAVDATSGEVAWVEQGLDQAAGILGGAAPAAMSEAVIAPFSSGELNAYAAGNGRLAWVEDLTGSRGASGLSVLNDVAGDPVISDGVVYAASQSGRLVAINLRNGERAWTRDVGGVQPPYIAGQYLFFVSGQGELIAMRKDSGDVIWVKSLGDYKDSEREEPIIWAGPVLAGGRLLLVSDLGRLVSVDPTNGNIVSETDLPGGATNAPVVANGTVYVLTDDATLAAYR